MFFVSHGAMPPCGDRCSAPGLARPSLGGLPESSLWRKDTSEYYGFL